MNMNDTRLTLISDPTAEFPNNANVDFKVRLAEPLQLKWDEMWHATMVSLSSSNRSLGLLELMGLQPDDIVFKMKCKLVDETSNTSFDNTFGILASEVMDASMGITTGEELWTRITRLVMFKQSRAQQATTNLSLEPYRIFQDEMVNVEMAKGSFDIKPSDSAISTSEFAIYLPLALKLGFVRQEGSAHLNTLHHVLGPNADYSPRLHYYTGSRIYHRTAPATSSEIPNGDDMIGLHQNFIYFSRYVHWSFYNLNMAFREVTKVQDARSVLVYSDFVQSTLVGNEKHSLLREVFVPESNGERQSIEPLHYQWLPMRNNIVEVVHVQLADLNGALLKLPPGKTLLTVALRHK